MNTLASIIIHLTKIQTFEYRICLKAKYNNYLNYGKCCNYFITSEFVNRHIYDGSILKEHKNTRHRWTRKRTHVFRVPLILVSGLNKCPPSTFAIKMNVSIDTHTTLTATHKHANVYKHERRLMSLLEALFDVSMQFILMDQHSQPRTPKKSITIEKPLSTATHSNEFDHSIYNSRAEPKLSINFSAFILWKMCFKFR